jgi:hypothetical protein
MKKIFFLMLMFLIMGAASTNAQVRIGGTTDPHGSAVLDLNSTNENNANILGLALPRVVLTATDAIPSGMSAPATGLLVYNTNTALGAGIYYWSGSSWTMIPNSYSAASGGGLSLSGTNVFSIADGGVTSAKIADGTIVAADLNAMGASSGQVLRYNGSTWTPVALRSSALAGSSSTCTGAIVHWGAYDGPAADVYINELNGEFEPNWSNAAFSFQGKDLCWTLTDVGENRNWADAKTACADLTTDGRKWRLPNLKELQVLYESIGGSGGPATDLSALDTYGTGVSQTAEPMRPNSYWSMHEAQAGVGYGYNFAVGERKYALSESYLYRFRCVRIL